MENYLKYLFLAIAAISSSSFYAKLSNKYQDVYKQIKIKYELPLSLLKGSRNQQNRNSIKAFIFHESDYHIQPGTCYHAQRPFMHYVQNVDHDIKQLYKISRRTDNSADSAITRNEVCNLINELKQHKYEITQSLEYRHEKEVKKSRATKICLFVFTPFLPLLLLPLGIYILCNYDKPSCPLQPEITAQDLQNIRDRKPSSIIIA